MFLITFSPPAVYVQNKVSLFKKHEHTDSEFMKSGHTICEL